MLFGFFKRLFTTFAIVMIRRWQSSQLTQRQMAVDPTPSCHFQGEYEEALNNPGKVSSGLPHYYGSLCRFIYRLLEAYHDPAVYRVEP